MRHIFTARNHREEPHLYIGQVAEITGATPKAIRLYESLQVIPRPARRGTYRVYSRRDVIAILLIKRAQSVGFSLNELRGIVAEKIRNRRFPLKTANALIEGKRVALRKEMVALRKLDRQLAGLKKELNQRFG